MGTALPHVVRAAGEGALALDEAARRSPKEAWRTIRVVGIVAVLSLLVWASFFAPWVHAFPDAPTGVSRRDFTDAITAINGRLDKQSERIDRVLERLPK